MYDRKREIVVCTSSLDKCLVILDTDMTVVKGMALDPTRDHLFFSRSHQSTPLIEVSKLDGTERTVLVDYKIVHPEGLCVDYSVGHLYWVDSYLGVITKIGYDGKNRKTVSRYVGEKHLRRIVVFESLIYVTSGKEQSSILKIDRLSSSSNVVFNDTNRITSLVVFHRQRQPDGKYSKYV